MFPYKLGKFKLKTVFIVSPGPLTYDLTLSKKKLFSLYFASKTRNPFTTELPSRNTLFIDVGFEKKFPFLL